MNQRMCSDPFFSNFSAVFLEIEIRMSRVDDFPDFWINGKIWNRFFPGNLSDFILRPKLCGLGLLAETKIVKKTLDVAVVL